MRRYNIILAMTKYKDFQPDSSAHSVQYLGRCEGSKNGAWWLFFDEGYKFSSPKFVRSIQRSSDFHLPIDTILNRRYDIHCANPSAGDERKLVTTETRFAKRKFDRDSKLIITQEASVRLAFLMARLLRVILLLALLYIVRSVSLLMAHIGELIMSTMLFGIATTFRAIEMIFSFMSENKRAKRAQVCFLLFAEKISLALLDVTFSLLEIVQRKAKGKQEITIFNTSESSGLLPSQSAEPNIPVSQPSRFSYSSMRNLKTIQEKVETKIDAPQKRTPWQFRTHLLRMRKKRNK
jgi:hypothetical protein